MSLVTLQSIQHKPIHFDKWAIQNGTYKGPSNIAYKGIESVASVGYCRTNGLLRLLWID